MSLEPFHTVRDNRPKASSWHQKPSEALEFEKNLLGLGLLHQLGLRARVSRSDGETAAVDSAPSIGLMTNGFLSRFRTSLHLAPACSSVATFPLGQLGFRRFSDSR